MSVESIISGFSHDEKLEAMEILWRDFTARAPDYPSPAWHAAVLKERLANPSPGKRLELAEAKAEILARFNASRTER